MGSLLNHLYRVVPIQGKTLKVLFRHDSIFFRLCILSICGYNAIRSLLRKEKEWVSIPCENTSRNAGGILQVKSYWQSAFEKNSIWKAS